MNFRRLLVLSLTCLWLGVGSGFSALAAEPAPSWRLVPEETMLLVRVPGLAEFVDALRRQTKFGKSILSPERLAKLAELFSAGDPQGAKDKDFESRILAPLDLKGEDYLQLLQGEAGIALAVLPRGEHGPLFVGLGWLEPKGDLAERLVAAIQAAVEAERDAEHPIARIDIELAGHSVTHLSIPILTPDMKEFNVDPTEEPTPEKIQQRQAKLAEVLKNAKKIESGRENVFFTRIGGRLFVCAALPQMSAQALGGADEAAGKPDLDELAGVEQATGVFARFLEAHAGQGGDTIPPILAAPGLDAALPVGVPLFEIVFDAGRALKLAETPGDSKVPALLEALGIDTLGALATRTVLDGTTLRSGTLISAPGPRHGLLTLLDQPALLSEPPDWAPASALSYQHISFDLGKAYTQIKELVEAQVGDQAKQVFDQVEAQLQAFLQTDVAGLLSSLGQQHTILSFAPKEAEAPAANANPLTAALSGLATARLGVVWQVKDEQVWNRLMQQIGQFVGMTNGVVTPAEEQGFNGYRVKQGPLEIGFFVGRGYLVLGLGAEVTESLLAVLRSPPTASAALRSSPLVERARMLLPPEAGLEFQWSDAGQGMKGTKELLTQLLSGSFPAGLAANPFVTGQPFAPDPTEAAAKAALVEKLKALLPSDEELEGSVGVSTGQTVVNGYGLVRSSAVELPAP